ncbi:hypothetical protein [Paractinoplanes rishiriensis]|uniref:Uncharacterized protein n=1 Tax=Paractinoplanes rishiriensis TaxID=1050105 RepID=A0A919K0K9_9ACTN|nr:hypothetical protein [Actinoplanes rishiriensis]GIE97199.1 hypothetical protein Ari01nite_46640 [Actinoplanes rishiriensis]
MTTSRRDADYAYDLTDAEQHTLDQLRSRVRPRRKRYLAPALAAAAAAAVAGAVQFWPAPGDPVVPPPAVASPAEVFDRLAAAAAQAPERPAGDLHQRTRSTVVSRTAAGCTVTATTVQTWTAAGTGPLGAVPGRLAAEVTAAPATEGCRSAAPRRLFDGTVSDVDAKWAELRRGVPGAPSYTNPRWIAGTFGMPHPGTELPSGPADLGERIAKMCRNAPEVDCAALRWTVIGQLLSSPEVGRAHRAAALELAAGEPGAVLLPAGDTFRVPYLELRGPRLTDGGRATTAELTLDPATGKLVQRVIGSTDGNRTEVTRFG